MKQPTLNIGQYPTIDFPKIEYPSLDYLTRKKQINVSKKQKVSDGNYPWWIEPLSGYIGGAAGIIATHPIDTIRTRVQWFAQQSTKSNISSAQLCRDLIKENGVLGFYRGLLPPVILRGFSMSVSRFTYTNVEKKYKHANKHITSFVCGFITGSVVAVSDCPLLVKTRAQTIPGFAENLKDYKKLCRNIFQERGLRTFFTGVYLNIPFFGANCGLFYIWFNELKRREVPTMLCGMLGALLSWPFLYPIEVIRTRIQATPMPDMNWRQRLSMYTQTTAKLYAKPVREWYPGLTLTLTRAVPRWGVVMAVHNSSRECLQNCFD